MTMGRDRGLCGRWRNIRVTKGSLGYRGSIFRLENPLGSKLLFEPCAYLRSSFEQPFWELDATTAFERLYGNRIDESSWYRSLSSTINA